MKTIFFLLIVSIALQVLNANPVSNENSGSVSNDAISASNTTSKSSYVNIIGKGLQLFGSWCNYFFLMLTIKFFSILFFSVEDTVSDTSSKQRTTTKLNTNDDDVKGILS